MSSPEAKAQIEKIARTSRHSDLQAAARYYLAGPVGPQAANALVRWYDSEQTEDVKMNILALLSKTQTHEATQKLRSVQKVEGSTRLRAQAEALLEIGDINIPVPLGQLQLPVQPGARR